MSTSSLLSGAEAASLLREAKHSGTPIAPLRERLFHPSTDLAYAIQEENTRFLLAQGHRLVGRKIGLTSPAVQKQLGVDQPDFGMLFDFMGRGDTESIPLATMIQPKIEAEIAVVLGKDLPHQLHTYADLLSAIEYVVPAIEIVDSRIENWNIQFVDTVADNASSGLFVLGSTPTPIHKVDLTQCSMQIQTEGKTVSTGNGSACLGNPLNAAVWLANTMVKYNRSLKAGDIILTGALGPMVAIHAPARYQVFIEGLGHVSTEFTQ